MYDKATIWGRFTFLQEGTHTREEAKQLLKEENIHILKWDDSQGFTEFEAEFDMTIEDAEGRDSEFETELEYYRGTSKHLELTEHSIIHHNKPFEP